MPVRTPTEIIDARGGYITHKNRKRPNQPTDARPIGTAPKWLTTLERKVWKELVTDCAPGVLQISDRNAFAVLCRYTTKFRAGGAMLGVEVTAMLTLFGKFGMNSADRSRVTVEKPKVSALSLFIAKKPTADESRVN